MKASCRLTRCIFNKHRNAFKQGLVHEKLMQKRLIAETTLQLKPAQPEPSFKEFHRTDF